MTVGHRILQFGRRAGRPFDLWLDRRSRQTPAVRQRIMNRHHIELVVDVGAHNGEWARMVRSWGYEGQIHSLEPLPGAYNRLLTASANDDEWHAHPVAASDRAGQAEFHVAGNEVSSSLYEMTDRHVSGAPASAPVATITVETCRLDQLDLSRAPTMLKIDVQGAERNVLDGATGMLAQVLLIEIELSLTELYRGQALWVDEIVHLAALGFDVVWIERGFTDVTSDRLLQVDALFARRPRASE